MQAHNCLWCARWQSVHFTKGHPVDADVTCETRHEPHRIICGCPDFLPCTRENGCLETLARIRDSAAL